MSASRRAFLGGTLALAACRPATPDFREGPDGDDSPRPDSPADSPVDTGEPPPDNCFVTPPGGEGPYFRADAPSRTDLRTAVETGVVTTLSASVRSTTDCRLIPATVELWHVQQDAVYDMVTDTMHYRTKLATEGRFEVITLKPVSYGSGDGKMMPSHYHLKINAPGHRELITQLRYAGDPYDDGMLPAELLLTPTVDPDGTEHLVFDFFLDPA